eukprot:XP_025007874.1 maestro heat-like repeat-containing protein family member 2B [Gallus gallus]
MDILGSLDVSVSGMTKLLWPRLLLYVVPAQYTGMLIPVSHCVQALAERGDLMVQEIEELDPHFLSSMFQGPLLTPQTLLARLLVVAGSPFAGSELQAAALLLMQNLHRRIHRAVGAMWAAEIPLLLQCLQGKDESLPDSAEWEQRLLEVQHCRKARNSLSNAAVERPHAFVVLPLPLCPKPKGGPRRRAAGGYKGGNAGGSWERDCCSSHLSPEDCGDVGMWEEAKGKEPLSSVLQQFLRASLDTMEDEAWIKGLSCKLSQWLSSSPSSSGEKSFLYKALGTVLGACKEVLHIQEKLLQHLEEANAEEPSEAQVRSPPSQLLPASPVCPWGRGLLLALLRAFRSPHCCCFPQARTSPATVAGRTSRLRPAPTAPCSFVQGMISLLSHAAESNFHTVLDTLTMFASRLCKGQNGRISRRKKMELDSRRAQATRSALILAHGSLALRASKEQLLARLEGDMVGNILLLYSCSCRDLQNTLALLQSITDFSSAFQAVGDSACFNPSLKGKLLEILTVSA